AAGSPVLAALRFPAGPAGSAVPAAVWFPAVAPFPVPAVSPAVAARLRAAVAAGPPRGSARVRAGSRDDAVGGLDPATPFDPGLEAPGEVVGLVAGRPEDLGRQRRSAAGPADEDDRAVAVDLLGGGGESLERDVLGSRDPAGLPLVVLADVDQHGVGGDLLARIGGGDVKLGFGRLGGHEGARG